MQTNDSYTPNQQANSAPQVFVGSQFDDAQNPTQTAGQITPANSSDRSSRNRLVKGAVVTGVALLVFLAGFATNAGVVALNHSDAQSAGKAMVASLIAGNSSRAYELASKNLRSQETASALLQSAGNVQTSNPTYSDQNVQINGDNALYVANVSNLPPDASGKTDGLFVLGLVKQGLNSWKIDSVSVQ